MTAILRTADTTCRQAGTGTLPQAHRGHETDTGQTEQLKAENALDTVRLSGYTIHSTQ